jgi:hypothetical protein
MTTNPNVLGIAKVGTHAHVSSGNGKGSAAYSRQSSSSLSEADARILRHPLLILLLILLKQQLVPQELEEQGMLHEQHLALERIETQS